MKKLISIILTIIIITITYVPILSYDYTNNIAVDEYQIYTNNVISEYKGMFNRFCNNVVINDYILEYQHDDIWKTKTRILGLYHEETKVIDIYYNDDYEQLKHTILHELGHAIDYSIVNKQIKNKLMKEYSNSNIKLRTSYSENFADIFTNYVLYNKTNDSYSYHYKLIKMFLRFYNR